MSSTILSLTNIHQDCQIQKKNGRITEKPTNKNLVIIIQVPT